MECKNCGSHNIEKSIRMGNSGDAQTFGLKYSKALFSAVVPVYCDLCLDCKEIVRMYLKDDTNRKWIKK